MRVRLSYAANEYVHRQTPGASGRWGDAQFDSGPMGEGDYHAWAVYEHLLFPQTLRVDPNRLIFIAGEPRSIRTYHPKFLSQFAAVIAPQAEIEHRNLIVSQPAIPWWVGVKITHQPGKTSAGYTLDYDQLKAMRHFEKPKLASVICSDKSMTEGHRIRLHLLEVLHQRFNGVVDFFGHGFKPIADKWDAIAPYRYHIVLENTRADHYWTEKLADAYLGGAMPIYCGAPNLPAYFAADSFEAIDRNRPEEAILTIERVLREDRYAQIWPSICASRDRILDQYNLYPMLAAAIAPLRAGEPQRVTLRPENDFTDRPVRRYKRSIKRLIFGAGPRSG